MTSLHKTRLILIGGFLTVLLCMAGLVSLGVAHFQAMDAAWEQQQTVHDKVRQAFLMREAVRKRTFSLAYVTSLGDFFERDAERMRFRGYAGDFIQARERLVGLGLKPGEEKLLERTEELIRDAQPAVDRAMEMAVEGVPRPVLTAALNDARQKQQALVQALDRFVDHLRSTSRTELQAVTRSLAEDGRQMAVLAGALFVSGLLVGSYVIRREIWSTNALVREIGERRHAETKVRELNRDLEARVAERTGELTREIQRREAYEARLRESEERHRAVIETAADGIITLDSRGAIETFNPAAERIFGHAEADVLGRNFGVLLPEPTGDWRAEDITAFLIRGDDGLGTGGRELAGQRGDGTVFPLSLAIREMGQAEERRFVALVEDISERKRAEQATLAEKERAETYLDVAEAMFLELDRQGRVERLNRRCCAVAGCEAETIRGRDYFDTFIPADERDTARQTFTAFVAGGAGPSRHVETPLLTKSGETRVIRWHDTLRFDAQGRVVGTLSSGQDVTEFRQQEETLRQAKNEAELANRAKSEFLANMSHELRTPLNAIIGFSDMIRSHTLGSFTIERYQDYLNDIHASGEHLLELVNDILDVSKIEAGRLEVYPEPLSLAEMAESALRLVRHRAEARRIALQADVAEDLPALAADPRHLKQILLNLLSNAVKFSHPGDSVRLAARPTEDGGLRLTVTDTGIGMSPEQIPNALKAFIQVDRGRFASHEGTGLGLPLTKGLVEANGGSLTLDSAPEKGTTVTLTFPPERLTRPAAEAPQTARAG